MSTHDKYGREYAKYSELKDDTKLECDGSFDCIPDKSIKQVCVDADGYAFIECSQGSHYLSGQLADDGDHLVGLYPVVDSPA